MYSEGYGNEAQTESKPSEKPEMRNLMWARKVSMAKTLLFRPLKLYQVRESAFLAPQVKLRIDWQSDRCGQVSSPHIGSLQSFRSSGSSPINTPPPPSFRGGCSTEYSLTVVRESTPPKPNPPKHKSYWSEPNHYDLGRSLLAFLSWRTASLLDG
jgi:hypothetical protein